jgi:antiviral helicase SKI2
MNNKFQSYQQLMEIKCKQKVAMFRNEANFIDNYNNWLTKCTIQGQINELTSSINNYQSIIDVYIEACQEFLFEHKFISEDYQITELGRLAINLGDEANPLLLAKILQSDVFSNLTDLESVAVLAMFCADYESDVISSNKTLHNVFKYASEINDEMTNSMAKYQLTIDDTWTIDQSYIDITFRWISTGTESNNLQEIITQYDIFEGNFVKNMIKLNKLIEKVVAVALDYGMISIADKLKNTNNIIIKGVVCQESIYLTL